jgi:hypothetical protein
MLFLLEEYAVTQTYFLFGNTSHHKKGRIIGIGTLYDFVLEKT